MSSVVELRTAAPRLGFLGVGWIGLNRMRAVAEGGCARIVGIADTSPDAVRQAVSEAPGANGTATLDELLDLHCDGIVIATPSAMHAAQAVRALERGVAVFCQKPLARTAEETRRVVRAARSADRLLGVDLSYRHVEGARRIRQLVRAGALGRIRAIDLTFHNAYGPDKAWFRDAQLSGGGCAIDLGTHLIDMALWLLDGPAVHAVRSRLYAGGTLLPRESCEVEDLAFAELELDGDVTVRMSCSWNLHAGADARIEVAVHGTGGGAMLRNVNGSFLDFVAERFHGTTMETLASPPDAWGGRAVVEWANALASGARYDAGVETSVAVAETMDAIYGR